MTDNNKFGKTICSICYEDLKPIVEDLQVISICGHVFHELCLQQWFEYCTNTKKCTCPVCKQSCSAKNVSRLYFQSIGDQNDPVLSQRLKDREAEDPEVLRDEVKRLEVKISRLNSSLESQGKELKEIKEELCLCKERSKVEVALKNEVLREKLTIEQLLNSKSQEIHKLTMDRLKLQERNMALAKELAAMKLASDLTLEEDEVLRFASLGNEANNKDTVDILRKSLVIRNKNYTELMTKCNHLGRETARSCKKLEKAKEKINRLKMKVQELETAIEVKDNEVLRALKESKKKRHKGETMNGVDTNSNTLGINNIFSENQMERCSVPKNDLDCTKMVNADLSCSMKRQNFDSIKNMDVNHTKEATSSIIHIKERSALISEDPSRFSTALHELSSFDSKNQTTADTVQKSTLSRLGGTHSDDKEVAMHEADDIRGIVGSRGSSDSGKGTYAIDEDVILIDDDSAEVQHTLNIKKESPSPLPLPATGDVCFSGGLLGPDGTNRFLGKWCKRGQNMQGSVTNSGNLISVGADGRGGRTKFLRPSSQFPSDGKENSLSTKRSKFGAKTNSSASQGCLQIEHFFGKASH